MRLTGTVLLLITASLACEARSQASPPRPRRLPQSYVLYGVIRDSSTGAPVSGAQLWPFWKGWGAVTDASGRYELRWHGRAETTIMVRLCNGPNLAQVRVDFFRDSLLRRDVVIPAAGRTVCGASDRLPWAVDGRDTTRFQGHYVYSWEGGGWLQSCTGARFAIDWDSALGQRLRSHQQREGQATFVEMLGRPAPARLVETLRPGYVMGNELGPLFLVNRVVAVRRPTQADCRDRGA